MNGGSALYEISNLWYTYTPGTRRILDIPSLTMHEGECIALLGPNGSGKTSLLKLLNHLLPWQDDPLHCGGELYFRGRAYTRDVARRVSVYLHQHPWILRGTVAENIAAVGCSPCARLSGHARQQHHREKIMRALEAVGLQGQEHRDARSLSGGEAQRLALARVLASEREVLLLDEPTANVDQTSARLIEESLCELRRRTTILFSTHDWKLAEQLADRIIDFGEVLQPKERRRHGAHESAS